MRKAILICSILVILISMSGCYTRREDIETIRYNAWEEGYQEGFSDAASGADDAFYDDYDFGYRTGWDEALKEYGIDDSGSDTSIGTGFRDGWVDALYEYDITP